MAKTVIAAALWMLVGIMVGSYLPETLAFAEDVDWKMYGSEKLAGEKAVCFFDAKSINHRLTATYVFGRSGSLHKI
jgi:hypothetical protein